MVPNLSLGVPDYFSLAWPDSIHDICCTILHGSAPALRFVGNGIFEERCVCITRNTYIQTPEAVPEATRGTRNTRRTRHSSLEAESEATRGTRSTGQCLCFFLGGGGFEPQSPYHTSICSGGGGV